jgi:hypothetical protein
MRNVSDKSCRENENTFHGKYSPLPSPVYEMVWKYMVEPDRAQMIRRRKDRFASGITKARTQNM